METHWIVETGTSKVSASVSMAIATIVESSTAANPPTMSTQAVRMTAGGTCSRAGEEGVAFMAHSRIRNARDSCESTLCAIRYASDS